jgi:hypothetical protein
MGEIGPVLNGSAVCLALAIEDIGWSWLPATSGELMSEGSLK